MPNPKNSQLQLHLNRLGLALLAFYGFGASVAKVNFAELHLEFPGLPFPVFIGEILLFCCALLALPCFFREDLFSRRQKWLLGIFAVWIAAKALSGYATGGVLALRNAALFYYIFVAVFAFVFVRQSQSWSWLGVALILALSGAIAWATVDGYFRLTYVFLLAIWVLLTKNPFMKGILMLIMLGLSWQWQWLLPGSRSHLLGLLLVGAWLAMYFCLQVLTSRSKRLWALLALLLVVLIGGGLKRFNDISAMKAITSWRTIQTLFTEYDLQVAMGKENYAPRDIPTQSYSPRDKDERDAQMRRYNDNYINIARRRFAVTESPAGQVTAAPNPFVINLGQGKKVDLGEVDVKQGQRSLATTHINTLFRLFVWRDMLRELKDQQAWGGFSFGHPQRSISLEILGWGDSEWLRDGWIAPHNSFLHILYRAGLVGVILIAVLVALLGRMMINVIQARSLAGCLFIAIVLYWWGMANSLVVWELPYYAIPSWSLFGAALAYAEKVRKGELFFQKNYYEHT